MPNDQFGRPVAVGDSVTISGSLTLVTDDPNYVNCTVLLGQQMPPTGSQTYIQLNTQQLVLNQPPDTPNFPGPGQSQDWGQGQSQG